MNNTAQSMICHWQPILNGNVTETDIASLSASKDIKLKNQCMYNAKKVNGIWRQMKSLHVLGLATLNSEVF